MGRPPIEKGPYIRAHQLSSLLPWSSNPEIRANFSGRGYYNTTFTSHTRLGGHNQGQMLGQKINSIPTLPTFLYLSTIPGASLTKVDYISGQSEMSLEKPKGWQRDVLRGLRATAETHGN